MMKGREDKDSLSRKKALVPLMYVLLFAPAIHKRHM